MKDGLEKQLELIKSSLEKQEWELALIYITVLKNYVEGKMDD